MFVSIRARTGRNILIFAAGVVLALGLAGCGKQGSAPASGPSPYAGHDEAWFQKHPKELGDENVWCKQNNGYFDPMVKDQAKTYDPACDIAAKAYYAGTMDPKNIKPGAF